MSKKKIFIGIGIFWLLIIWSFVAFKEFTLQTGKEVFLETRPVDPRDLFRGDYVVLNYQISTIKLDGFSYQESDFKENDKIYVQLKVENKIASLYTLSKKKPKEWIFLKGVVKRIYDGQIFIEYGIESYFVPEGKGKQIEKDMGKIYTKIAIDDFGNAVIKWLILNGLELKLE
jgi:uncharacterized membrane-anchored protein